MDNNFSKSLKNALLQTMTTLEELSAHTGISKQTLSKYQNGLIDPTILPAYKIAKFFNLTIEEMIIGDIYPEKENEKILSIKTIKQKGNNNFNIKF